MITKQDIEDQTGSLEQRYVEFMVKHFADWEVWARISRRMAEGENVDAAEVPDAFLSEFKMMKAVLTMEASGSFDWNSPVLREAFAESARSEFYVLWGEMITEIALRVGSLYGVQTYVEVGAGRGNLTSIMVDKMSCDNVQANLVVTDTRSDVLEAMTALRTDNPRLDIKTFTWNIMEKPSTDLLEVIRRPCLIFERASIVYATIPAVENIGHVGDCAVFGDWFNTTGRLYAYDEVFKRIGAFPLLYADLRLHLERCFGHHFFFDARARDMIDLPNTTLLVAWKGEPG